MDAGQTIKGWVGPLGDYAESAGLCFAPFVRIALGNDPSWKSGDQRLPQLLSTELVALIDTGSDVTRLDAALIATFGLEVTGTSNSTFTGIQSQTQKCRAQLCFPEALFVVNGIHHTGTLRAGGQRHDVLIGLDLLQYFDFNFRPRAGVVELTYLG